MNQNDQNIVLGIWDLIKEFTNALAGFHKACGDAWPEDGPFWGHIYSQEVFHSASIRKIQNLLAARPELFMVGNAFDDWSLKLATSGIKSNTQKLKEGKFARKQLLYIAKDITISILNRKYGGIVKTGDKEYLELLNTIVSQTTIHKDLIERKIADIEQKAAGFQDNIDSQTGREPENKENIVQNQIN